MKKVALNSLLTKPPFINKHLVNNERLVLKKNVFFPVLPERFGVYLMFRALALLRSSGVCTLAPKSVQKLRKNCQLI